jgi:TrpR-related protein YerC/YecD
MPLRHDVNFDILFETILSLQSLDECYTFFDDLCTIGEITDMRDRLEVATLLMNGKTYEQIEQLTHMSSATISRVNRCLQHGDGGYRNVIQKAKK